MTASNDRVHTVIEAFLDYLDGTSDEPSFDDLDTQERARAEEMIASLVAGRGMDPYASRPSLERLLAGTPFEAALRRGDPATSSTSQLLDEVRNQLARYTPFHIKVRPDDAATALGIHSDFIAVVGAQRLRIQIHDDINRAGDLATLDPAAAAGPVYGTFPDTAGVILMYPNDELASVAVDPFDPEYCVEAPTGTLELPTIHRPVLPLVDTVRSYLDEFAPVLDASVDPDAVVSGEVDIAHIARSAADRAIEGVVIGGRRAKLAAKQTTWSALGQPEVEAISELVLDAIDGLDHSQLASRIATLGEAA